MKRYGYMLQLERENHQLLEQVSDLTQKLQEKEKVLSELNASNRSQSSSSPQSEPPQQSNVLAFAYQPSGSVLAQRAAASTQTEIQISNTNSPPSDKCVLL
jgi:cell division septum initiation protein DivIVA